MKYIYHSCFGSGTSNIGIGRMYISCFGKWCQDVGSKNFSIQFFIYPIRIVFILTSVFFYVNPGKTWIEIAVGYLNGYNSWKFSSFYLLYTYTDHIHTISSILKRDNSGNLVLNVNSFVQEWCNTLSLSLSKNF